MNRREWIAAATSLCLLPALPLRADTPRLQMRELYDDGMAFSDLAHSLDGQTVVVEGYMAPPLKADSTFFVLTRRPMVVCPFCETEAEWPDDILGVYTARKYRVAPFNRKIEVTGVLSIGSKVDPDTGFLSRARIENARYDWARA